MKPVATTPAEIAQSILYRHTDRIPADATAVMQMIGTALETLGEEASPLIADLVTSFDRYAEPNAESASSLALLTEKISAIPANPSAERVQQWGAIMLLGMFAMARTEIDHVAPSETAAPKQSMAYSTLAYQSLKALVEDTHDDHYRNVAQAFLSHPSVRPEDLAAELSLYSNTLLQHIQKPIEPETAQHVQMPELGGRISEPFDMTPLVLSKAVQSTIDKMDWLKADFDLSCLKARRVYHDGAEIAIVVDFTPGNTKLQKLMREVENSPKSEQFWNLIRTTLIRQKITARINNVSGAKVPTLCGKNVGKGVDILRAYLVPLGNDLGDIPILALVAGVMTKSSQKTALNFISKGYNGLLEG